MAVLGLLTASPRDGSAVFRNGGTSLDLHLIDFWRWSTSNLLSNATRGVLAEFIVGSALGCVDGVRDEWSPYDLRTPNGVTIEVKSSAYIQTWHQRAYSRISFGIQESRYWDGAIGDWAGDTKRQAIVYVFALLAHKDQETVDALNLDQWTFYVLPTSVLNETCPNQNQIGLPGLLALAPETVPYETLAEAVERAAVRNEASA